MDLTAALNILTDALARCRNEDMRTVEVFVALNALAANATAQWPFEQFRKALDSDNEEGRWQNLNASLNAVRLAVGRLACRCVTREARQPLRGGPTVRLKPRVSGHSRPPTTISKRYRSNSGA